MRDWRQIMCSIMVHIARASFEPDEEDEDLRAIHQSFGHSLSTGEQHYGLQISNALPGFSHTAIASDQRVCFRLHSSLGQLHSSLVAQHKKYMTLVIRLSSYSNPVIILTTTLQ